MPYPLSLLAKHDNDSLLTPIREHLIKLGLGTVLITLEVTITLANQKKCQSCLSHHSSCPSVMHLLLQCYYNGEAVILAASSVPIQGTNKP